MTDPNAPLIAYKLNKTSFVPSEALIARIKKFYKQALIDEKIEEGSIIWMMIASKQQDIHDALLKDDNSARELLSNPSQTNLYYGVDNLARDLVHRVPEESPLEGMFLTSLVTLLAECLGQKLLFNPDGGNQFPDKSQPPVLSPAEYMDKISTLLGIDLQFPNPFTAECGIILPRGMVSVRTIHAIYQVYKLRQLCALSKGKSFFSKSNHCLEIGAGMGRTAYFARQLGLNYTIIDLPMTIVGQALFLAATLGENAIWLPGDEMAVGDRVALLPPSKLNTLNQKFDVVLNVDSLTEMDEASANTYMKFIQNNAKFFISINHEANFFTVNKASTRVKNMLLLSRTSYDMRKGYVEELFAIQ